MNRITDEERREAIAMSSFRVRFTKVNRGPHVYSAEIYIDGAHFGRIQQRSGNPYEAFTAQGNELIATAGTLSKLREQVIEHYASNNF